ncbi:MAG: MaoC family dehydratase [Deltaproteobacteria bacterium]|nr:MaoC family dehydratase [Deltaproteobacteria bacterium]
MNNEPGTTYRIRKTISESDVYLFGGIIGDSSSWHIDEEFVKETVFKKRLVYGMLTAGFFSTIIGRYFAGHIYLSQEVSFKKPVFIGDTIEWEAIVEKVDEKGILWLSCTARNINKEAVLTGTARIKKL